MTLSTGTLFCCSALSSRYSLVPPCQTAIFLPTRSWTLVIGEPFFTRMPSPSLSGATAAKSLKPGLWVSAVVAEVIEPSATSSSLASNSWAAGAKAPAVPVQTTLAWTAARALASEPSLRPRASTPELPPSGIRITVSWVLPPEPPAFVAVSAVPDEAQAARPSREAAARTASG